MFVIVLLATDGASAGNANRWAALAQQKVGEMNPIEKLEELRSIVLGNKIDHPAWDWMNEKFDSLRDDIAAQQNMHWTAGIVRRFKHFPVVKIILSLWHSLSSRQ